MTDPCPVHPSRNHSWGQCLQNANNPDCPDANDDCNQNNNKGNCCSQNDDNQGNRKNQDNHFSDKTSHDRGMLAMMMTMVEIAIHSKVTIIVASHVTTNL